MCSAPTSCPFIVKRAESWVETEAQWISIKPKCVWLIRSLQKIFIDGMGDSFVSTPLNKLHITVFRGIRSSLKVEQQEKLMRQIAEEFFKFDIEIVHADTYVESGNRYVTWHFNSSLLIELQEKVQSATKTFLQTNSLPYQEHEFAPHITLGVINQEYNRKYIQQYINQCTNCANVILKKDPLLQTSFPVKEIHLTGVNGLNLDVTQRTHYDLFAIKYKLIEGDEVTRDIEKLVHYATENDFNGYKNIRYKLIKVHKIEPLFDLFALVENCLEEKTIEEKRAIYKKLRRQQRKFLTIQNNSIEYNILEKLCILSNPLGSIERQIQKELSKKHLDVARELLIREQSKNIILYINYLLEESDMTHIDTIFELVKNIGCANEEFYNEYIKKLVKNRIPIERIRICFEEACSFFKKFDVCFIGSYLQAERTLENGSFEKIEEFYSKRAQISDVFPLYFVYFRILFDQKRFDEAAEVCKEAATTNNFNNASMFQYLFEWTFKNYQNLSEIEELFRFCISKFKRKISSSLPLRNIYSLYILKMREFNVKQALIIYQKALNQGIHPFEYNSLEEENKAKLWLLSNIKQV